MSPSVVEEPPLEKKSPPPPPSPSTPSSPSLFSSLPNDVVLNCLARVSRWDQPRISLVCKSFRSLMASTELQATRSILGHTELCLYFCLRIPFEHSPQWFVLRPTSGSNLLVPFPTTTFPSELPRYSSVTVLDQRIYIIGGSVHNKATSDVFLLDPRSHTCTQLPSMRAPRWGATAGAMDGKIYVIGGCDEPSTDFGEVFDPKTQSWEPLPLSCPKLGFRERAKLSSLTNGMMIDGKIYGMAYRFVTARCFSYDPMDGTAEFADEGIVCGLRKNSCVVEKVLYSCHPDNVLRWYDVEDTVWREVKGVSLPSRVSSYGKMANSGGNLGIFWKESMDGFFKPEIWCTEIVLERRSRYEIRGKVKRSNVVFKVDYPCFHVDILECLVITI